MPRLHFDERIANARKRFKSLKSAGLIGGHNPASASIRLVEAEIWPLLDSGREAADLFLRDAVRNDIRRRLSVLQLEFSKDILGTSVQAVSAGVLGELGEIPEGIRNDGRMSTQEHPSAEDIARYHAVGSLLADLWLERTRHAR